MTNDKKMPINVDVLSKTVQYVNTKLWRHVIANQLHSDSNVIVLYQLWQYVDVLLETHSLKILS